MPHAVFKKTYAAFLFDMDGTLLSSIEAAERVWGDWAHKHGLDKTAFLKVIHGVRAEDTIRKQNLEGIDVDAEVEWIAKAELEDVGGIVAISGIADFLRRLPNDRWAIVTSATLELASRRLTAAGLVPPPVMVTAEDVAHGKPAPDCFQLAAKRLGVDPAECLVFEDAPAGIMAAEAAGADVMVIKATHQHPMETRHASIHDYRRITVGVGESGSVAVREIEP